MVRILQSGKRGILCYPALLTLLIPVGNRGFFMIICTFPTALVSIIVCTLMTTPAISISYSPDFSSFPKVNGKDFFWIPGLLHIWNLHCFKAPESFRYIQREMQGCCSF